MTPGDERLLLIHTLLLVCSVAILMLATTLFIVGVFLAFGGYG